MSVHFSGMILAACALFAQAADLRFDVASVKPNRTLKCQGRWDFSAAHGTLAAENAPLLRIVSRAFNLTDDRVSGPGWMESECYDIRAKAPASAPNRDLMAMLQILLKQRFHLASHVESEERPVSVLVVDKGGLKLRAYDDKGVATPPAADGKILFMARHLPDLCERLAKVTGRPVIDKTDLTGDYMIVLSYLPFGSLNGEPSDPAADIFAALRDQLGLRLEPQRGMVDILKIDSINKVPTAN